MMDSSSSPHPMMPGNETVYGTHEDTNMVMSEKVEWPPPVLFLSGVEKNIS